MSLRPESVLAVLTLAALATWWLARGNRADDQPVAVARLAQPGYYLRDATLEETDDTGRIYLRIATTTADQDPASEEIKLGPVRVDYFPAGTAPWVLTAKRGKLPRGARLVALSDSVTLTGSPIARSAPAVVRTSAMSLDTLTSIATTTAPVRIELGPQVVSATGMRADLKQDRIALESNVRGHYVR